MKRSSAILVLLLPVRVFGADFATDVRPLFAKHCVNCHGPEKQKGGLRLDRRADALKGGDGGRVIVPRDATGSRLYRYVTGLDKDVTMPPEGPRLSDADVKKLKEWIDAGAIWPDDGSVAVDAKTWWSFLPVARPAVPPSEAKNPIDAFIRLKLKEKELTPSPEADRRTLIRRLYFDLTGLPPSPEEIDAFTADRDPAAYEKLVDRLLASPRYGERWARHWLDVVHYGDTHGYDKDKPRPNAWPYRDYVIRAFNEDKPYARFVREQIAGDVLYPGTRDGVEALGFLAAGPWDFIGHAELPETKIDGKVARHLDRDDFVSNTVGTFLSLTVHCAQCHNHKFDPISQDDYYALQAVFAAIDRAEKTYDRSPAVARQRAALQAEEKHLKAVHGLLEATIRSRAGALLDGWEKELHAASTGGKNTRPAYGYHSAVATESGAEKWVQIDLGKPVAIASVSLRPCYDDFNNIGAGFGFPVRFRVEVANDAAMTDGRRVVMNESAKDFPNPGTTPVRAETQGVTGRYVRITATKLAPRQNDYIFALAELEVFDAAGKNVATGAAVSAKDSTEAAPRWRKSNLTDGYFPSSGTRSADDLAALRSRRDQLWTVAAGPGLSTLHRALSEQRRVAALQLTAIPKPSVVYAGTVHSGSGTFVGTGANGGKPRPVYVLPRGDVTKIGKEIGPGGIVAVPGGPARFDATTGEGERRAALANWLTDGKNPLVWRSIVNRVWLYHFGRGIVDTPNDFGRMGQIPTHPELLDWLAAEFRDNGQSLKTLHRLIVTSGTYKQISIATPRAATVDAENRYFARQNRRKLDAESVRDVVLSVAGKLDLTMFGPGYQDFVIERPEHSPHYEYHLHDPEDPKSHRRAVYRFVVRSKSHPFMAAWDCADPSLAVDKRTETVTPQQALAQLNDRLILAMAKHVAARVEKLAPDTSGRVEAAFRLATGRLPTKDERDTLVAYAEKHGLVNACRVVLNLNEVVFVD